MKKVLLVIIFSISVNASSQDVSGLVNKVKEHDIKMKEIKIAINSCHVVIATNVSISASWDSSSKVKCKVDEFATGGGCDSDHAHGGMGKFLLNNGKATGYQCLTTQGSNDQTTAQAVCCKEL